MRCCAAGPAQQAHRACALALDSIELEHGSTPLLCKPLSQIWPSTPPQHGWTPLWCPLMPRWGSSPSSGCRTSAFLGRWSEQVFVCMAWQFTTARGHAALPLPSGQQQTRRRKLLHRFLAAAAPA